MADFALNGKIGLDARGFVTGADKAADSMEDVTEETQRAGKAADTAGGKAQSGMNKAQSGARGATGAVNKTTKAAGRMGAGFKSAGSEIKTALGFGAGLGAIELGVMAVQKGLKSIADTNAFNTDQVAEYKDLVLELADGTAAVTEQLEAAQAVTGRAGGLFGSNLFEETKDITQQLIDAGVTWDEFIAGIEEGGGALEVVTGKLRDRRDILEEQHRASVLAREDSRELNNAVVDAGNALEIVNERHSQWAEGLREASIWQDFANTKVDDGITTYERWQEAVARSNPVIAELVETRREDAAAAAEETAAVRDHIDALDDEIARRSAVVTPFTRAQQAAENLTTAQANLDEVQEDGNSTLADTQSALLDVVAAQSAVDVANGDIMDSGANANATILAIGTAAGLTDDELAFLEGGLDGTRAAAEAMAGDYHVNVITTFTNVGQPGRGGIFSQHTIQTRASGGHSSGLTIVGEEGPELIDMGARGGYVYTAPQTSQIMSNAGTPSRSAGASGAGGVDVRVFVGDRELTDIVDVQIDRRHENSLVAL